MNIKVKTQDELDQAYLKEWKKYGFNSVEEIKTAINDKRIKYKTYGPIGPDIIWSLDGKDVFSERRTYKTVRHSKGVMNRRISWVKFTDIKEEKTDDQN